MNETGGGLGGLVAVPPPPLPKGFNAQYVQGIGSFRTFDEFAGFTYGSERWHIVHPCGLFFLAQRLQVQQPRQEDEHLRRGLKNIIGQYHPEERNRSGAFRTCTWQEVYYNTGAKATGWGSERAWYINSNRELPMLTTDYGDPTDFENRQREQTFRSVLVGSYRSNWKLGVKGGYHPPHGWPTTTT